MNFSANFLNQKGQIASIFLFIFATILVFFMMPRDFARSDPHGVGGKCQLGDVPSTETKLELPTIKGRGGGASPGGPDSNSTVMYHLIRKNVLVQEAPIFKNPNLNTPEEHSVLYKEANQPGFAVYYPGEWGEVTVDRLNGDVFFRQEGIIFFVHTGADNKPLITKGTFPNGDQIDVYTIDFYQDEEGVNKVKNKQTAYTYEDIFACPNTSGPAAQIMIPNQQVSKNNEQLQLEWFLFNSPKGADFMTAHCKPAIYLYPPSRMQVNVKVAPAGTLIYTDPQYDSKNGWTVEAYPDGKIYDSRFAIYDKPFTYLYFESKVRDQVIKKPTKGWVVQSSVVSPQSSEWFSPLEEKFNVLLPQLGLNAIQTKDFIDYWKKALPHSPYYFIGIIDQSNVDQIERLEITPKPDIINRVRIYFERLDQPRQVEAPNIVDQRTSELVNQTLDPDSPIHQSTNSLFRVVEWGGMVKNDPNHPFTCSQ